jgi:hypothetical protein
MKDPFVQYGKEISGTNDLGKEIGIMLSGQMPLQNLRML